MRPSEPGLRPSPARLGLVGLGTMGRPMARNLLAAGRPLVVWNRTPARAEALTEEGAEVASTMAALAEACEVILLVLADEAALDSVLARSTPAFETICRDRTLVQMATVSPDYSRTLASEVEAAGGRFVEAPLSGSRIPAERGELVGMFAGPLDVVAPLHELLDPVFGRQVYCGPVPSALQMKFASNMVLAPLLAGLAEAWVFAERAGLDPETLSDVLLGGQIDCGILRAKLPKLRTGDFEAEGAVRNALESVEQTVAAAGSLGLELEVTEVCRRLLARAATAGFGEEDIIAIVKSISD